MGTSGASRARQFAAVLQKNFILQIRGRRSFLGVGGWAALLMQVLLPALFFTLMCIPKYYIQPYEHPVYLQQSETDIDTRWWAGASPYEGPALAAGGKARIAFVPNTPEVTSLVRRLAMAVSCPSEPYKRICSSASITTWSCLFSVQAAPEQCQNSTTCMLSPECYQAALQDHLLLLPDEAAVEQLLRDQPHSLDAVVVFTHSATAATAAATAAAAAASAATAAAASGRRHFAAGTSSTQQDSGSIMSSRHQLSGVVPQPKQLVGCGAPGAANGDGLLLNYVIRMNSSDVPPTQLLQDMFDVSPGIMPLPGNLLWEYRKYWFFVNLQLSVDRALLGGQQSSGGYPAPLNIKVKPFPWPAKQEDLGAASAAAFFNLLLVYAFMAPTRAVVGSIVREKELRLREGMRILGLSEAAYWWSWSVTHWLTLAASGLLCAAVGLYPFRHSSFGVMLAFYWLFSAALISFSYFLSTLFSASRVAGTATQFIYALSMIPGFLLPFIRPYGGTSWYIAALSPTSAASLFAAALVNWERLAAGVSWNTLWLPVTPDSGFCAGSVFWLLTLDVVLFAVLTWYFDKVVPQPHGQTLPPWFPLLPSYWRAGSSTGTDADSKHKQLCGRSSAEQEQCQSLLGGSDAALEHTPATKHGPECNGAASGTGAAHMDGPGGAAVMHGEASAAHVSLRGLRKVFHSAEGSVRVAVEGLTLDMWAGRVTALLGHNGAGKTTTIHMLTGMLQPTAGTALIGGHDIRTSMGVIRQSLGICPQFDILWPDITVQEHLQLYSVIRGATWQEAPTQALQAAAEVGLSDKLSCLASELSGGQRRKLSVAIAFLGEPAVVFLDEPTSGMDPYSRRTTWDVIRRRRVKSVIVLTTHSMEEADLLCDDIHIMADGRLAASGSPLSLKARYGVGYTLTLVLQQPQHTKPQQHHDPAALQHGMRGGGSSSSLCSSSSTGSFIQQHARGGSSQAAERLLSLVQQEIPAAQLLSAAGSEVSIRLPKESAAAFPAALRALDAAAGQLGVASYGLSVTTLEEVFLSIADQAVPLGPSSNLAGQQRGPDVVHANGTSTSHARKQRHERSDGSGKLPDATGLDAATAQDHSAAAVAAEGWAQHPGCEAEPQADVLSGMALYWQQFKALFVKRALCARRDRLAVITQLLVPLLLVVLAMAVSTLDTQRPQQPPLKLARETCLMGKPALLAAAPGLRQQQEVQGFMDGYPRGDLTETLYTHLYHGSSGPALNLTLEGQLLSQWSSGRPHYDALFLQHMPPVEQLLSSLTGPGPSITLLVNQSAVSALPASLNQVTSALLRLMVAAGGAKSRPQPAGDADQPAPSTPAAHITVHGAPELLQQLHSTTADTNTYAGDSSSSSSSRPGAAPRRMWLQLQSQPHSAPDGDRPAKASAAAASGGAAARTAVGVGDAKEGSGHTDGRSDRGGERRAGGGGHLPSCMPVISTVSSPLPLMEGEKAQRVRQDAGALMLVLCMTLATSVLSASFVVFLVRETDNNSKHLQLVSGAHPTAYWLANFCWDLINYCVPAAGIVLLVYWYHQPQLSGIRLVAMGLLLLAFGGAGINLTYLSHFLFVDEMKALQRLNTAYFLTGYLGFLTTWVLSLIALILSRPSLNAAADRTKAILRLLSPHYCFAQGLYDISNTAQGSGALPIPGLPHGPSSPFTYAVLGSAVVHLLVQALVYGAAAVLVDVGIMQLLHRAWSSLPGTTSRLHSNSHSGTAADSWHTGSAAAEQPAAPPDGSNQEGLQHGSNALERAENGAAGGGLHSVAPGCSTGVDADVAAERCAVEEGDGLDTAMVVLDGIHKQYSQGPGERPVVAVSGLWLRVWPGECFGLLGVNGAGKTTTFKVLTGEVTPDSGDARVSHFSVLTQLAAARQRLGYCPQFEALPAAMTGREVLTMYARLRGASGAARIAGQVEQLLQQLGLVQYADVACGSYSGGNKRKLSVAVALVGNPPLVLLDEPSTGMDPAARRFLWRVLQTQVLSAKRTIILTSHSMEEVDALASRLVIMAAGSARCLGTPQHLKNKFGDGYTLELRISTRAARTEDYETVAAAAAGTTAAQQQAASGAVSTAQAINAATDRAEHYFESVIPGTSLLEKEPGRLLLRLPLGGSAVQQQEGNSAGQEPTVVGVASLSDVFEAVEAVRESLCISEYCLAQSSLERVFLSLASAASHAADGD